MSNPIAPPSVLGACAISDYAATSEAEFTGSSHLFVDGKELGMVPYLAIGEQMNGDGLLLLHCDASWNVLGVSAHDSVQDAKERAERIYRGLAKHWIHRSVSMDEAAAYLDVMGADSACSFCGRGPYDVQQMIVAGNARICDSCIRECHELIVSEPLVN